MARLIDADAWIEEHCDGCKYKANGICSKEDPVCGAVELMNEAPTVDAVEVVRCKDCKHYVLHALACRHENFNGIINMNGFCSYGERRTDNG